MKQIKLVNAYKATEDLAKVNFSKDDQWKIYCFRKALRPHIEFQEEQENKLVEKYKPYADEQGIVSGKEYIDFLNEKRELNDMDVEFEAEKIELPLVDGIIFKTIESLEDFIEFKK